MLILLVAILWPVGDATEPVDPLDGDVQMEESDGVYSPEFYEWRMQRLQDRIRRNQEALNEPLDDD